jgi:N-acetylmuramoyl-L-alanine amidase
MTLARGSQGTDVKELQQNLKTLGCDPGLLDGYYGSKTEGAVLKFQSKNGLKVDGVSGAKTQAKIQELLPQRIAKPLQGFAICIDPGHGGKYPSGDPGAVDGFNPNEGDKLYTREADINFTVGTLLYNALISQGGRATMTRSSDWYPSLRQRCDMANKFGAQLFISLHCNSGPSSAVGIETLYLPTSANGKRLAELVQQELVKATREPNRGAKARDNLYVLKHTNMPAILVEMGFISNPEEEERLNTSSFQELIVDAIVRGVERYKKGEKA